MKRFYERYIQDGQYVSIIAFLIFVGVRLFFAFADDSVLPVETYGGILWDKLVQLIPSPEVSVLLSSIFGLGLAMLLGWMNNKYAIIRERTSLPMAFILLLFSIEPRFVFMSPHYVAAVFLLLAMDALFASYQESKSQRRGVAVGMYLAVASLFVTEYLVFLPLFLIGFSMMRSFSGKVFLSTLLPYLLLYLLTVGCFMAVGDADRLLDVFDYEIQEQIYILSIDSIFGYVISALALVFFLILAIDNRMNNYRDKIKVRECVSFFYLLLIFSFLVYCLSPIERLSQTII